MVGTTGEQPLVPVAPEVFALRKLLPTTPEYDFNMHVMDFEPGEFLQVKEVHYNQHGLLLLEGQGIYRLADQWYPVTAGDAVWMAPFVVQWYGALGKHRSRYIINKDTNRGAHNLRQRCFRFSSQPADRVTQTRCSSEADEQPSGGWTAARQIDATCMRTGLAPAPLESQREASRQTRAAPRASHPRPVL